MAQGRRKEIANYDKRQRHEFALDTIEGKKLTAELYQAMVEDKARRPEWFRAQIPAPCDELAWTVNLPGYERAVDSAITAFFSIQCESELYREWWVEHRGRPDPASAVFKALSLGMGSEQDNFRWLSGLPATDPLRYSRKLTDAIHKGRRSPVTDRWSHALGRPPGESTLSAVALGRLQDSVRLWIPGLWTWSGLWLANSEDATIFLRQQTSEHPAYEDLRIPVPDTYHKWTKQLKLHRYEGVGRVVYNQNGRPHANRTLLEEAGRTMN